ncbi:MAG: hypothetical protein ABI370_10080 [Gammaproteobacteria bacterium]
MKSQNLDSLVKLMNSVTTSENELSSVMTITNPQYNERYLLIFLDEIKNNNGTPTYYDSFREPLWTGMDKNADDFADKADEFITAWNGWCDLYNYLRKNNVIK